MAANAKRNSTGKIIIGLQIAPRTPNKDLTPFLRVHSHKMSSRMYMVEAISRVEKILNIFHRDFVDFISLYIVKTVLTSL